jgi:riboflavin biosynthesis pyrimidine reductase
VTDGTRIRWRFDAERRFPFGAVSPDPERATMLGFPPPWPDRPWIFGVMVASTNGVVAWRRRDADDDPVLAILGGDPGRRERMADLRQMRFLRIFGDCAIGAETHRQQRGLVQTPQEPGEPPVPALYGFRTRHGLPHHPRNVMYSLYGRVDLGDPVFNTPGLDVIVLTLPQGAASLEARGAGARGIDLIVEPLLDPEGLRRAHRRLFAERGVRYLDCEGGETVLRTLHAAGLLDEVFVTTTDAVIDASAHEGVLHILDFEREGAELIAEGTTEPPGGFTFRRWRFNDPAGAPRSEGSGP